MADSILQKIAARIRTLRRGKKVTVRELASLSHVSKGLLSKIENGKTTPSLPVFISLMQSLQVSPNEFFDGIQLLPSKGPIVVRKNKSILLPDDFNESHFTDLLRKKISHSAVNISMLTIKGNGVVNGSPKTLTAFHFIVSGTCLYEFAEETIEMSEGDAICYEEVQCLRKQNPEHELCTILSVNFEDIDFIKGSL